MTPIVYYVLAGILSVSVLAGIKLMSSPKTAVTGNLIGAVSMVGAIILTLIYFNIISLVGLWVSLIVGTVAGLVLAIRVKMIQMPQTVSLLNGFGGAASAIVAFLVLYQGGLGLFEQVSAVLAYLLGVVTFFGSVVGALKLMGKMKQKPLKISSIYGNLLLLLMVGLAAFPGLWNGGLLISSLIGLLLAAVYGTIFAMRVGGADMPITISLLNSFSGVAGAIAGLSVGNPLLVAISGIVGASGLILTRIMCRAMNRSLGDILTGKTTVAGNTAKAATIATNTKADLEPKAEPAKPKTRGVVEILKEAKRVVIIPGYGMALSGAQGQVKALADLLVSQGKDVQFAIHPVAGRMPGHMNVLLAEVDVPYEKLLEMGDVNPLFPNTDVAIIVGANDVVNPAAQTAEGTPIYGLPVLEAHLAKDIIVCNFDDKPGYAGVDNPLYKKEGAVLLWGDAKESVGKLIDAAKAKTSETPAASAETNGPAKMLQNAKRVIIIPGYGMALSGAQGQVKALADLLVSQGKDVQFAIHPVAGRMPGHMNVLLAEVDVPYEKLLEMGDVNPLFPNTDVAIIVGANDVVNPAAQTAEGTPIYGLPVLEAHLAKDIIVCNFDDKPGYAGVDNPLYKKEGAVLLWGDAKESVGKLIDAAKAKTSETPAASAETNGPAKMLQNAKRVIIIPGYGMALSGAQGQVKALADLLVSQGKDVQFAIHPVAGRMPGHMNVLLAEVDVPYEKLLEMGDVNPLFPNTDVAIIVGANDVVNPAAQTAEGTPIYGLPVLEAHLAKDIIVCNFDDKPGYAGVDNPLYKKEGAVLLWGDAKESVGKLIDAAKAKTSETAAASAETNGPAKMLQNAKRVIIIPGYGMALSGAQGQVKALADLLVSQGKDVQFAIHPVAGRMPGHMNVLLAEVDVPYEKLLEMGDVNPLFPNTDVAIIVGANDVVNPAAQTAEGTPIYGLPVLEAHLAKDIIVCNFDDKPGYAGVDNPLYKKEGAVLLWGDAKESVTKLIEAARG